MDWQAELIDQLGQRSRWGYVPDGPTFAEPAALATVALSMHGQHTSAVKSAEALREAQNEDGSVGIYAGQPRPGWPTGWAIIAWSRLAEDHPPFEAPMRAAVGWLLGLKGEVLQPNEISGHDVTLVGWPWVRGTHSWLEPTVMAVLALRTAGHRDHPRVLEAERLLLDRQLPGGGCNYGNTLVFGQKLLPHSQPTGMALMALSTESLKRHRAVKQSVSYLERQWPSLTGVASRCYAALGLTAQGRVPPQLDERCEQLFRHCQQRGYDSAYHLALLALAVTRQHPFEVGPSIQAVT
ncbi:MAG: hypothetical protein AAGF97_04335 [Planctomycetota bacterium]